MLACIGRAGGPRRQLDRFHCHGSLMGLDPPLTMDAPGEGWRLQLLFDAGCPLCQREVNLMRQRDGGRCLIDFVDIDAPDYEPANHGGISYAQAMGRLYVRRPDGSLVSGLAALRELYCLLGIGWLYAPTGWPGLRSFADAAYAMWARYRLPLTRRPNLARLCAARGCVLDAEAMT